MVRKINPGGLSRLYSSWLKGNLVIAGGDAGPVEEYFVDGDNGNARNDGLSWERAKATIQSALDLCATARGRARVYVAPASSGYAEDLITPLNSVAPFGQLIAYSPTSRSGGAVYLTSATATEPVLTVRARGWLIDGFEFDSPATDGCIYLDGVTANSNARYTEIANCLFSGYYSGTTDFGVDTNEASNLVVIRDSIFFGFANRCITASTVVTEQWEIARCVFQNSANYIAPKGSKGFAESYIHDNVFFNQGGLFEPTIMIDMRVGRYNHITNNFLGGTYDNAGGYYASGTDFWYGNACEDSHQNTNPA